MCTDEDVSIDAAHKLTLSTFFLHHNQHLYPVPTLSTGPQNEARYHRKRIEQDQKMQDLIVVCDGTKL